MFFVFKLESIWEAGILPLNYSRLSHQILQLSVHVIDLFVRNSAVEKIASALRRSPSIFGTDVDY
jgi:hypothetical protein